MKMKKRLPSKSERKIPHVEEEEQTNTIEKR